LEGSLIARKGAAVPAHASSMTSTTTTTVEKPRAEPISLTVKLEPELYLRLRRRGMRTKPRKSNQVVIMEAIKAYLGQEAEDTP